MAEEILTHSHSVVDVDPAFLIDPHTNTITAGPENLILAQHAIGSERLTFRLPEATVETHDMTKCNKVEIHYQNIDSKTLEKSIGVYEATDLAASDEGVTVSWLIDKKVTRYAGGLVFSLHFLCISENDEIVYDYPTLSYSKITVGATVWNSETIEEEYPDIIEDFEERIAALERGASVDPAQIQQAVNNYMEANPVAPGATAEQAAQIQANAEAIADIQDPVVSGNTAVSGNTYTLTMPRESGVVDTVVVEFDDNGYVSKVTENGRAIPWTTTGV